jgi:hypothetical protein
LESFLRVAVLTGAKRCLSVVIGGDGEKFSTAWQFQRRSGSYAQRKRMRIHLKVAEIASGRDGRVRGRAISGVTSLLGGATSNPSFSAIIVRFFRRIFAPSFPGTA